MNQQIFLHPFALGFYLGCVFLLLGAYNYLRLKGELTRFRRHLSDRLELEAEMIKKIKADGEALKKENESLRMQVNSLNQKPDNKIQRHLEVYARAEKQMVLSVPGFAPAWEMAKEQADRGLREEEVGKTQPKSMFKGLFGGGSQGSLTNGGNGGEAASPEA